MHAVSIAFVLLVAALHSYFLWLEMFRWTHPRTMKIFGTDPAIAEQSAVLAANQGLYNGFLAAGLVWAAAHPDSAIGCQIALYFLGCVAVAAAYGAWSTGNMRILAVQGAPAVLGLMAVLVLG